MENYVSNEKSDRFVFQMASEGQYFIRRFWFQVGNISGTQKISGAATKEFETFVVISTHVPFSFIKCGWWEKRWLDGVYVKSIIDNGQRNSIKRRVKPFV